MSGMNVARIEVGRCRHCGRRVSRVTDERWRHDDNTTDHWADAEPATVRDLKAWP